MDSYYEHLLERSNRIKSRILTEIAGLDQEVLTQKESPKKWSAIEVVDHLNKVYDIYLENFDKTISAAPKLNGEAQKYQRTVLGRLSVYTNKPKGKKRKFKMKTFDFFYPTENIDCDKIIKEFAEKKEVFNTQLKEARLKNLNNLKMPTALGEKMKFYVSECFDFLLAHEERHMVQIDGILDRFGQ